LNGSRITSVLVVVLVLLLGFPTQLLAGMEQYTDLEDHWDLPEPILVANTELQGGIMLLEPGGLESGGYAPLWGYEEMAGPVTEGQTYLLRDHTGEGYASLKVIAVGDGQCTFECVYNPGGTLLMD